MPLSGLNSIVLDNNDLTQAHYDFTPLPNSTTLTGKGITFTVTGTATAFTVANTNRITMTPVIEGLVTTASTTAVSGFRTNYLFFTCGDVTGTSGAGGFYLKMKWRPATGQTITTHRAFAGVRGSSAAPTDVNPSTLTNIIGMGWDAADTTVQILHNDGTGTATKINLGANFPRPNSDRSVLYVLELYAPRLVSEIRWKVTQLVTGASSSGTITSDIPAVNTLLALLVYTSVGGTSSVIGTGIGNTLLITNV